jgi:hypothetical protein
MLSLVTSRSLLIWLIGGLLLTAAGCSRPKATAGRQAKGPVDACSLLNSNEIKKIQGEGVQNTKPTGTTGAEFIVSQCYFTTTTPVNSVVLTITQKGTDRGGRSLRDLWKETFGTDRESEEKREKREGNREEEEEARKPEPVSGLGDEAFWTGGRFGGAMYVLKDDYHIRISVGGADDQETKKTKSKRLVELVLKRL